MHENPDRDRVKRIMRLWALTTLPIGTRVHVRKLADGSYNVQPLAKVTRDADEPLVSQGEADELRAWFNRSRI